MVEQFGRGGPPLGSEAVMIDNGWVSATEWKAAEETSCKVIESSASARTGLCPVTKLVMFGVREEGGAGEAPGEGIGETAALVADLGEEGTLLSGEA